jgi:heptaprenyl diphosphate synthase
MENKDAKIAFLIAAGAGLQVAENVVPYPVPGLRIGLANVVTLYAINKLGGRAAFAVAVLRPLAAGAAGGWLATPMSVFSFSGSVISCAVMLFVKRAAGAIVSNVGISVAGSLAHVFTQMAVFALFAPPGALLSLFPVLIAAATAAGIMTGYAAGKLEKAEFLPEGVALPQNEDKPAAPHSGRNQVLTLVLSAAFTGAMLLPVGEKTMFLASAGIFLAAAARGGAMFSRAFAGSIPFLAAGSFCLMLGIHNVIAPVLKMFSFFMFSAAVSGESGGSELLRLIFGLLKPAEKIGLPVDRARRILDAGMSPDFSFAVKSAAGRLLARGKK